MKYEYGSEFQPNDKIAKLKTTYYHKGKV